MTTKEIQEQILLLETILHYTHIDNNNRNIIINVYNKTIGKAHDRCWTCSSSIRASFNILKQRYQYLKEQQQ